MPRRGGFDDLDVATATRGEPPQAEFVRHAHGRDRSAVGRLDGGTVEVVAEQRRDRFREADAGHDVTAARLEPLGHRVLAVLDRDVGQLEVADAIEVERAHRLAQVAPPLQVPLTGRDEHLHGVDRARGGCGIRRLVGERDRNSPLQRLGDRVPHGIDGSGGEDHVGRRAGGSASELGEKSREQLGVADAGDRPGHLQTRQEGRGFTRGQFRRALEAHGVGDDDDVALVQEVPVDVEEVVRHLPVAAVAGEPDHREGLDHGAHLIRRHVELVGGFGDRDLSLADQVGHELEHERRAVGGDERLAGDHAAPPWAARAASRRAITWSRSSVGSTTRTSGPYEANSFANTWMSTNGTWIP